MKTLWGWETEGVQVRGVTVFDPRIVPAIELLRKEEPGAFVVRDSSSYRGSFGLALKVQEAPAPSPNRSGMHSSLSPLKASQRQGGMVGSRPSSSATSQPAARKDS